PGGRRDLGRLRARAGRPAGRRRRAGHRRRRRRTGPQRGSPTLGIMKRSTKRVGLIGTVVGLAAAGVAAGVATERYLVRRHRRGEDPYADEPFTERPFDESRVVRSDDGVDLYVEIVDGDPTLTLVFIPGYGLDMGTFYFQRKAFAGHHRSVFYDQPGHGRSGRLPK